MEHDWGEVLAQLEQTHSASREGLALLLGTDACEPDLCGAADRVRRAAVGDEVHLRALIEFSSYCRRSCRYCGLRREHCELARRRMTPEEIPDTVRAAADLGYRTVVLQSGEGPWYTAAMLSALVREIKAGCDAAITLSSGERGEEEYRALREAGADRFLLRIEMSSPELYAELHPEAREGAGSREAALTPLPPLQVWRGAEATDGSPTDRP